MAIWGNLEETETIQGEKKNYFHIEVKEDTMFIFLNNHH